MIHVEQTLRQELGKVAPAVGTPDWNNVLARAGRPRLKRAGVAILLAAAIAGIVLATPLGAALRSDFSSWLTGEPGSPAPAREQRAFDRANARTWLGFPAGTKLRRLTSASSDGRTVALLGFRSRGQLCLRAVVSGKTRGIATTCAPLADLRRRGSPVRVMWVDRGFGPAVRSAWYGITREDAPALQVTAGVAADGVREVVVVDGAGRHSVPAVSNAFLYVASEPRIRQKVGQIQARTRTGIEAVPFAAQVESGFGPGRRQPQAPGPLHVQRLIRRGTIGWLERHEPRGDPLPKGVPRYLGPAKVIFGRVVRPDPSRPERVAVSLVTGGRRGRPRQICVSVLSQTGVHDWCDQRAAVVDRLPVAFGPVYEADAADQYQTIAGIVSNDVVRLVAFLSSGKTVPVPFADNAFLIDVALSSFPIRIVAYDRAGLVIKQGEFAAMPAGGGPRPARGRPSLLLRARSASGARADLLVGGSTTGGLCWYARFPGGSSAEDCERPPSPVAPLRQLGLESSTRRTAFAFVVGRVADGVAAVQLRFADGDRTTIRPTKGFVLYTVPRAHLAKGRGFVGAIARDAAGKVIGSRSFR